MTTADTIIGKTMGVLPLLYKKVVPLNKEAHKELYLKDINGYQHTKETNSVYITAIEFTQASREYPIVFAIGDEKKVFPVVLLGLEKHKNLFVNEKNQWLADYIPAYVRRYPFILASSEKKDSDLTVCIDTSYPGFNTTKEGKALFSERGEPQEPLNQAVDFLAEFQKQIQLTTLFCDNLSKLDILEPMQADLQLMTGAKYKLSGFMGVNREKLKAVEPEKLAELVKTDQMELIYAHLASLVNVNGLIKHLEQK